MLIAYQRGGVGEAGAAAFLLLVPAILFAPFLAVTAQTFARPAVASRLPRVATTPDQLTAANVAVTFAETTGQFVGPILVGVLLTVGQPELVLATASAISAAGALLATLDRGLDLLASSPVHT